MPWPVCPRSVVGATTITTVGLGRSKPPWLHVSAVGQSICIVGSKETATWRHLLEFFSRYYLFELTGWVIYLSVWVQVLQVKGCKRNTMELQWNTCNIYVYFYVVMYCMCACVCFPCVFGVYAYCRVVSLGNVILANSICIFTLSMHPHYTGSQLCLAQYFHEFHQR